MSESDARLMTGENIVFRTSKHWAAPVADSWRALLLIIGAGVLAWLQTEQTDGVVGFFNRILNLLEIGLFLSGLALIVFNVFSWRSARYTVTNQRVLGQEGLLRRRETDSLLTSISDVRTKQSFAGRRLGYGSIVILTASGDAGADSFTAVRQPELLKRNILEQKVAAVIPTRAEFETMPVATGNGHMLAPAPDAPPAATEVLTTLAVLASLRDAETITGAEYESKKTELLARI